MNQTTGAEPGNNIDPKANFVASRYPGEHDNLNPWVGVPPNLVTAQRWRDVIVGEVNKIDTELANARNGLDVYDDTGAVVSPNDLVYWRRQKLNKKDKRLNRLRYLKRWIDEHEGGVALTKSQRSAMHEARDISVPAMFAAAKRFEMLDELHRACMALADEDSDENWARMTHMLDVLDQHGIQE